MDVAVFESGYHGGLTTLIDVSEKSFRKLPQGKKDFVHIIPLPADLPCSDSCYNKGITLLHVLSLVKFQFICSLPDPEEHIKKAEKVIQQAGAKGQPIGAFLSEMIVSAAGVIIPSKGYYQQLYK